MRPGARRLFRMLAALLPAAAASAQESRAPFHLISLPGPGRTAFAEIADLDGDGRGDLAVGFAGEDARSIDTLAAGASEPTGCANEGELRAWRTTLASSGAPAASLDSR